MKYITKKKQLNKRLTKQTLQMISFNKKANKNK